MDLLLVVFLGVGGILASLFFAVKFYLNKDDRRQSQLYCLITIGSVMLGMTCLIVSGFVLGLNNRPVDPLAEALTLHAAQLRVAAELVCFTGKCRISVGRDDNGRDAVEVIFDSAHYVIGPDLSITEHPAEPALPGRKPQFERF